MAAPEQLKQIADAIKDKLLSDQGTGLIKAIQETIGAPGTDNGGPAEKIALSIIVPIIVAELTFTGIRIVFKQPFVDQFTRFTRILFIAYICIAAQIPQDLIRKSMKKFEDGGKAIGKELIKAAGVKDAGDDENPILYWGKWIGDMEQDKDKCKYHKDYIMKMFGEAKIADAFNDSAYTYNGKNFWEINDENKDGMLKWILERFKDAANSPIWTNMKEGMTVELFIALFMPFMVLSMILTAVMAQMAGYMAPVFVQVAILVGSRVVLEFAMALGIIVMPLMFFESFKDIWKKNLIFCFSISLIPCFYYVLSGLGFAFSTLVFDVLFDPQNPKQNLAILFKDIFITGLKSLVPAFFGWLGNSFNSIGLPIVLLFIAVFSKLYFFVGGTVIVTMFVAGGVGFASIAPGLAGKWTEGFADDNVMKKIEEFFTGVQGAIGSAIGQGYGQATSSATNLVGGGLRGILGK